MSRSVINWQTFLHQYVIWAFLFDICRQYVSNVWQGHGSCVMGCGSVFACVTRSWVKNHDPLWPTACADHPLIGNIQLGNRCTCVKEKQSIWNLYACFRMSTSSSPNFYQWSFSPAMHGLILFMPSATVLSHIIKVKVNVYLYSASL